MKTRFIAACALAAAITAPVSATIVTLNFKGTIPTTNSFFGSGPSSDFTAAQQAYIGAIGPGTTYDFTFSYDTDSVAVGGVYPLHLIAGRVGSNSDFSGFTPKMTFAQAGAYTYLNFMFEKDETAGPNLYRSYANFNFGDNHGHVVAGQLPTAINPADYVFVNASFEIYGRNQSYREEVDSQSRGVTKVLGAAPEPATWAMMVGGFGLIGGAMRRRRAVGVRFA